MLLPSWPPQLSEEQLQELSLQAKTYALAHGLLYLPVSTDSKTFASPPSAIHAPFALFPTPFPRPQFERAKSIQQIYNVLYGRVASDEEFLDSVLSADTAVGRVDEFVGELWRIWKKTRADNVQPLQLGIFRSDYLLHDTGDGMDIKQVELNTISASFGALSQAADGLHRYLLLSTGYFNCSNLLKESNLPQNHTRAEMVQGLAVAHKAYLDTTPNTQRSSQPKILFVIQPNERNVFDQRFLEYELLERHGIRVIRCTFEEIAQEAVPDKENRKLLIQTVTSEAPVEISVVYFRSAYTPIDYPTKQHFETREMIERTRAIKCPSIALQLAGSKKVQAVLSKPGVVESFLLSDRWQRQSQDNPHIFPPQSVNDLRESWVEMWGLEEENGMSRAREQAANLVLKPQREGGGNNIYKLNIPPFLDKLPESEREAWIAMELIKVPKGVQNWLMKSGSEPVKSNVISELGIFGWALFGYVKDKPDNNAKLKLQEGSGGYLLRTKGEDSDEGGVAAGFSVLDSIILVD
ncbi:glutathione synthase [Serendipita vermifera]|nr:glutathione synthase [Serendipita vermifera]